MPPFNPVINSARLLDFFAAQIIGGLISEHGLQSIESRCDLAYIAALELLEARERFEVLNPTLFTA